MKQSRILEEIHGSISRMHRLGIADKQTMKEFNKLCFKDIKVLMDHPRKTRHRNYKGFLEVSD